MIVNKGIPPELRWFYEARFGMFVHFGAYALLGRGEWVQYHEGIPRDEYEQMAMRFNPGGFDANAWVDLAVEAGARYMTVTAKHHDGFCLFDSDLTGFKITNTPFGRDLIGELAQACHHRDMRLILYYSQPDWHHPQYLHRPGAFKDLPNPPAGDRPDWDAYVAYYMGQVEELCTRYGRIDGIWFDGVHKTVEEWKGREVYTLIKKHQPQAVVNERARCGDFFTPERSLPEDLSGYLFEACESVSPVAWGYRHDTPCYAVPHLVRSLDRMAVNGGNYLLNVGPDANGVIPEKQARVMRAVGQWLLRHGQAVYATDPVFAPLPRVRKPVYAREEGMDRPALQSVTVPAEGLKGAFGVTRAGNRLFVHLAAWPESDRLVLPGIRSRALGVRLLGDGSSIAFRQDGDEVELLDLPCVPPDALTQTLELSFDGPPTVDEETVPEPPVTVTDLSPQGITELPAAGACLEGRGVKGSCLKLGADPATGAACVEGWFVPEHRARWRVRCPEAGRWRVSVRAGCPAGETGAVIAVRSAGGRLTAPMPSGGGLALAVLGTIRLPAGESDILLYPEQLRWGYLFGRVERVILERI